MKCTAMRASSVKRYLTLPRAKRCLTPSACRFRPSRVSSGKNSQPWRRVIERVQALGLRGILFDERDRVDLDVGVLADLVRVGVVACVLADPPAVADADDAGRENPGEAVVRGAGGQDRAVRRLVREERDLREDDAEGAGDEQLEPAVAEQDEPVIAPPSASSEDGCRRCE